MRGFVLGAIAEELHREVACHKTQPLLATTPSHIGLKYTFRTTGLVFLQCTM